MEQTVEQESIWLSEADIATLTGCKKKSLQVECLRKQGIAFQVNRAGRPVVAKAAIQGQSIKQAKQKWKPNGLNNYGTQTN